VIDRSDPVIATITDRPMSAEGVGPDADLESQQPPWSVQLVLLLGRWIFAPVLLLFHASGVGDEVGHHRLTGR
jgi:hypothetical protein